MHETVTCGLACMQSLSGIRTDSYSDPFFLDLISASDLDPFGSETEIDRIFIQVRDKM